ncbi:LPXTG cell wall anchor domain-containing protein [Staphylococcus agnetis]|uniref:LPXTG cell wall anchor domain-containing protein n=1 Tax=Staphylococcus agnetis TaxID=985762 RepID=UPI002934A6F3|nr:LPXTG cell wall anchor domain-containing protein [Staphylococcus agnetis]
MRENFKLRKMKTGLVSVAIVAMYMTMQSQAEASEKATDVNQLTENQSIEEKQVEAQPKLETAAPTNATVQPTEHVDAKQNDTKVDVQENFVKLDKVNPGDTQITGKTLPNQIVSLTIDGKSVGSVEGGDGGFAESDESGNFTFDLNDRNIVFNQQVDVASSNLNFDLEEEGSEDAMLEEEPVDATDSTTTGRYDKAYAIPTKQLEKQNGHHQVLVEPILQDSGIIKGHTSVKGRVALAINNKFVDLGFDDFNKDTPLEKAKARTEGIWKFIDDKGYFEFDFKRKPFESYQIKKDDLISLTFKPDDEEEALIPLIFNSKASDFANVATATTSYTPADVKKVVTLNNGTADLQVDDIHGFVYESDRGIDKPVDSSQGTREIKGKTKFANAVVNVTSSLGEGNEFPDLQVNEKGEFSFNASEAGFRLNNGEKLHFTVVDPLTGAILSDLVTKEITVAETDEERKNREMDELLEVTPAYFQIVGNELRGYDIHGNVLAYFDVDDKAAIDAYLKSLGLEKPNFKEKPELKTEHPGTSPELKSETNPKINLETSPKINPENTPKANPGLTPELKSETTPKTGSKARPKATPEVSPKASPESAPKTSQDQKSDVTNEVGTKGTSEASTKTYPVVTLGSASVNGKSYQPTSVSTQVSAKAATKDPSPTTKALPETGQEETHAGLIGTLLAGLGAVFVLRRKRKSN